ncbi:acylneuraminate cytidylyltransferase family protein [Ramlibacter sp. PS3R-8]|uniref:acylneuraminate cytidylyltransferase family protein n=1 Tax=Ramlibacter sp. PS3R-8 TaxID=3133437 RepID=UPI0030B240F7
MRTIAFIFARGGSKGVPGKNIKPLAGKPLIAHSIDVARACPGIETVIVSTDDEAIADVARRHGAEVPFLRPAELATDSAPEWLAWRHAIAWVQQDRGPFDVFLSLPATSPFRSVADVRACLDMLASDPQADVVITVREAERSPWFNMVKLDAAGYASLVIEPQGEVVRRQDVPEVFDMTTVAYAARPGFVLRADRLMAGKVRSVLVPAERALDIDTPRDFALAEMIAKLQASAHPS